MPNMKTILLFSMLFSSFNVISQETISSSKYGDAKTLNLSDSIKKYFDYDTLGNFSCLQVPTGIYALSFKVDGKQTLYDIDFSEENFPALRNLLTIALQKSLKSINFKSTRKRYLQLVYFNNILGCNNSSDTLLSDSSPIATRVLQFHVRQLALIAKTFDSIKEQQQCILLKPVIINDDNSNRPRLKTGFYNDQPKNVSQDLLDKSTKGKF